jgi:psiF repeat
MTPFQLALFVVREIGVDAGAEHASLEASKRAEGTSMLPRYLATVGAVALFAALPVGPPASAVTAAEKMETCKFGADDQKLAGAARKKFISRCMASTDAPAKRSKTPPPAK